MKKESLFSIKWVWLFSFLYCIVIAIFIQFIVLPHVFPGLHAGDGLLVGTDSVGFHRIAVELAEKIKSNGFREWQLRPEGHSPAGIAALFYALTGVHKPFVLVPLNAAVHATALIVLLLIIRQYLPSPKKSVLCVVPFLLFPTAIGWYAQIHKDGIFILGFFVALFGILSFFRKAAVTLQWQMIVINILSMVGGGFLVWIARPYGVTLLIAISIFISFVLFLYNFYKTRKQQLPVRLVKSVIIFCTFLVPLIILFPLAEVKGEGGVTIDNLESVSETSTEKEDGREEPQKLVLKEKWIKSRLIPSSIDSKLYTIANARYRYFLIYPDAGSTIDKDVRFHSAGDMIAYLPRALQISLFAPFPYQWFERGAKSGGTIMRKIVGAEMALSYVALIGLPFAIVFWRKRIELWVALLFSLSLMIVYSLTIPNIGALHRMRYGFYMIVLAVSVGGWITLITRLKNKIRLLDTARCYENY